MNDKRKMYRTVTSQQLNAGYYEMIGGIVYHRDYRVVRKDGPDTWIVHDPEQAGLIRGEST